MQSSNTLANVKRGFVSFPTVLYVRHSHVRHGGGWKGNPNHPPSEVEMKHRSVLETRDAAREGRGVLLGDLSHDLCV